LATSFALLFKILPIKSITLAPNVKGRSATGEPIDGKCVAEAVRLRFEDASSTAGREH
jgi:hypothetical protein